MTESLPDLTMAADKTDLDKGWEVVVRKQRHKSGPATPDLFPTTPIVEEHKVPMSSLNRAIVHKHFVKAPITAELALAATQSRPMKTSSGWSIGYNTVFQEPSHMVRISFREEGGRAERLISPVALPTMQCFYCKEACEWRASFVGLTLAIFTLEDHLDKPRTIRQLPLNYRFYYTSTSSSIDTRRNRGI